MDFSCEQASRTPSHGPAFHFNGPSILLSMEDPFLPIPFATAGVLARAYTAPNIGMFVVDDL